MTGSYFSKISDEPVSPKRIKPIISKKKTGDVFSIDEGKGNNSLYSQESNETDKRSRI